MFVLRSPEVIHRCEQKGSEKVKSIHGILQENQCLWGRQGDEHVMTQLCEITAEKMNVMQKDDEMDDGGNEEWSLVSIFSAVNGSDSLHCCGGK